MTGAAQVTVKPSEPPATTVTPIPSAHHAAVSNVPPSPLSDPGSSPFTDSAQNPSSLAANDNGSLDVGEAGTGIPLAPASHPIDFTVKEHPMFARSPELAALVNAGRRELPLPMSDKLFAEVIALQDEALAEHSSHPLCQDVVTAEDAATARDAALAAPSKSYDPERLARWSLQVIMSHHYHHLEVLPKSVHQLIGGLIVSSRAWDDKAQMDELFAYVRYLKTTFATVEETVQATLNFKERLAQLESDQLSNMRKHDRHDRAAEDLQRVKDRLDSAASSDAINCLDKRLTTGHTAVVDRLERVEADQAKLETVQAEHVAVRKALATVKDQLNTIKEELQSQRDQHSADLKKKDTEYAAQLANLRTELRDELLQALAERDTLKEDSAHVESNVEVKLGGLMTEFGHQHDGLETKLDALETKLAEQKASLEALPTAFVDKREFSSCWSALKTEVEQHHGAFQKHMEEFKNHRKTFSGTATETITLRTELKELKRGGGAGGAGGSQGNKELVERLDKMDACVGDTNQRLDATITRVDVVNQRVDETNQRVDETITRFGETKERADEAVADINKTKDGLHKVIARQDTMDQGLEKAHKRLDETHERIDEANRRAVARASREDELAKSVEDLKKRCKDDRSAASHKFDNLNQCIEELKDNIGGLAGRITAIEGKAKADVDLDQLKEFKSLKAVVDDVKVKIDHVAVKVDAEAEVDSIKAEFEAVKETIDKAMTDMANNDVEARVDKLERTVGNLMDSNEDNSRRIVHVETLSGAIVPQVRILMEEYESAEARFAKRRRESTGFEGSTPAVSPADIRSAMPNWGTPATALRRQPGDGYMFSSGPSTSSIDTYPQPPSASLTGWNGIAVPPSSSSMAIDSLIHSSPHLASPAVSKPGPIEKPKTKKRRTNADVTPKDVAATDLTATNVTATDSNLQPNGSGSNRESPRSAPQWATETASLPNDDGGTFRARRSTRGASAQAQAQAWASASAPSPSRQAPAPAATSSDMARTRSADAAPPLHGPMVPPVHPPAPASGELPSNIFPLSTAPPGTVQFPLTIAVSDGRQIFVKTRGEISKLAKENLKIFAMFLGVSPEGTVNTVRDKVRDDVKRRESAPAKPRESAERDDDADDEHEDDGQ